MLYRQLGSSDIHVSEISLGSYLTFGGGVSHEQAEQCVAKAFDVGINFIDTANSYSEGRAEEFLGRVLADRPRDSYILATKVFEGMPRLRLPPLLAKVRRRIPIERKLDQGLSRDQVLRQIDRSLSRLRTDYVDLYQCHRYDWNTPLDETIEALTEVVRQGKARYIGFSEWPVDRVSAALTLPGEKFISSQPQYSMIWRAPEGEVIPFCRDKGISQVVWQALGQGILTAKYGPGTQLPSDSRAASPAMNWWMQRVGEEELLERVQRLSAVAHDLEITMAQLALAWVLREPNVASAIVGATRAEQVEENAAASGIALEADALRLIDEILDGSIIWEAPAAA